MLSTLSIIMLAVISEVAPKSDNSDLMFSLVVLFGTLLLFLVSLVVRFRNTNNTMRLIKQLQDEE